MKAEIASDRENRITNLKILVDVNLISHLKKTLIGQWK